mgnify:CR=1 FL=1
MSKQEEPVITDFDAVPGIKEFTVQPGFGLLETNTDISPPKKAKKGKKPKQRKHSGVVYGYSRKDDGTLIPDPYEQNIITLIIKWREEANLSYKNICKRLQKEGYKARSDGWHESTIQRVYSRAKKSGFPIGNLNTSSLVAEDIKSTSVNPPSAIPQNTTTIKDFISALQRFTDIDFLPYIKFIGRLSFSIGLPDTNSIDIKDEAVLLTELERLASNFTGENNFTLDIYIYDSSGGEALLETVSFQLNTSKVSMLDRISKAESLISEAMTLIQELKKEL